MKGLKTWKLAECQKAEIIAKLATGNFSHTQLAEEYGVTKSAISRLRKRRGMTHSSTQHTIAAKEANIQVRLLEKGYKLLERKFDGALGSEKASDQIKLSELSHTVYDLWKQQQVEALKPTEISLDYTLTISAIKEKLRLLESGTIEEMFQSGYES